MKTWIELAKFAIGAAIISLPYAACANAENKALGVAGAAAYTVILLAALPHVLKK